MSKQLIYQVINIITSVLIAVASINYFVWNVTKHNDQRFSFSRAIIMMYYTAFAIVFVIISFRDIDLIDREMHFLSTFSGRGLIYLFIGLSLWTTEFSFPMIASVLIVIIAIIYILQHFKGAEPEF